MHKQDEIELIIHIGMGKTGTTTIQRSLLEAKTKLVQQSASYLGMWFSFENASFIGTKRTVDFFNCSKLEQIKFADEFLADIKERNIKNHTKKFILSNEQIFANIEKGDVFFERINENVKTKFVCFVRNPHDWLQSAYYQWSVKNKTYSGKAKSLTEFAEEIVVRYEKLQNWHELFPENFSVIQLKKNMNAVDLFSKEAGLNLPIIVEPKNTRGSKGEIILRNLFNNTFDTPITEREFSTFFKFRNDVIKFDIDNLIGKYTDSSSLNSVIKSKDSTWKFVLDNLNINLLEVEESNGRFCSESAKNDLINILLTELILRDTPLSD